MSVVPFNYEQHIEIVNSWGEKHQFHLPPKDALPKTGFMVNNTACGFLYQTDSVIGIFEWVFADPSKTKEERNQAIDKLFEVAEVVAKVKGIKMVLSYSAHNAYTQVLERNNFQLTDNNMTHYVKKVGN